MPSYTPNYNLYKPNRNDTEEVDVTLTANFEAIDTDLKNKADKLNEHAAQLADIVKVKPSGGDDTIALQNVLNTVSENALIDLQGKTFKITGVDITTKGVKLCNGKIITTSSVNRALVKVSANDVVIDSVNFFIDPTFLGSKDAGCLAFQNAKNCSAINSSFSGGSRATATPNVNTHPIAIFNSEEITIHNCRAIEGLYTENIYIEDSLSCKITSSVIEESDYSAIALVGKLVLAGNHVVSNNVMKNCGTSVITVDCDGCLVSNNHIDTSTSEQGINIAHVGTSKGNKTVVTGNHINNAGRYGIAVTDSKNVLISSNIINNSATAGIRTSDISNNVVIVGNLIDGSKQDGIIFSSGDRDVRFAVKQNEIKNVDRHGISILGGTVYEIVGNSFINVNNKAGGWSGGGDILDFVASTVATPKQLLFVNNTYRNDSELVGLGASRGLDISNSVTSFDLTVKDNDLKAVLYEKVNIGGTQPTYKNIKGNKLSSDPVVGSFVLLAGDTTKTITNGNQTSHMPPRLHFTDGAYVGRYIRVSSYTNGSFVITCTTGSVDSTIQYEIV